MRRPAFKKNLGIILSFIVGGFFVLLTVVLMLQVVLSIIAAE